MKPRSGADESPPTVRPPFDPETFARDSEKDLRPEEGARSVSASARPTQPPPADYAGPESSVATVSIAFSVESDDVLSLALAREQIEAAMLSPLARWLVSHVNEQDTVAVLCDRAGLRMDDALTGLEELAREGVVFFYRSTR
jgi:hypothetical protein